MGRKLDALLGRTSFKASKFKATANLAVARLAVLKNQRQGRCSIAQSDVVQLLNLGHHERALLRVEHVIKEQNMWDAYVIIEGYCLLLTERLNLIAQEKVCPDELKEAVSSLIYAAARCGDFPELQEIRSILTSRFGKEVAARAVELRNSCGVNPKMIQKLSTRTPVLENRIKVLKEIANDNNIVLQIEEPSLESVEVKEDAYEKLNQHTQNTSFNSGEAAKLRDNYLPKSTNQTESVESFTDMPEVKNKYKDVADAAQAAFESAAFAAAAARAAVELSRSESLDPDDPNSPNPRPSKVSATHEYMKLKIQSREEEKYKQSKQEEGHRRSLSSSSSYSADNFLRDNRFTSDVKNLNSTFDSDVAMNEDDDIISDEHYTISKCRQRSEVLYSKNSSNSINNEHFREENDPRVEHTTSKRSPLESKAGLKEQELGNHKASSAEEIGAQNVNAGKRPISVRTRRAYW